MPLEGHIMLFKAMAEGEPIYLCKTNDDDTDRFEWVLKCLTRTFSTSVAGTSAGTSPVRPGRRSKMVTKQSGQGARRSPRDLRVLLRAGIVNNR
jgi:hypothetical protein